MSAANTYTRRSALALIGAGIGICALSSAACRREIIATGTATPDQAMIALPPPALDGAVVVETALLKRRSVREYSDAALELAEIGQLLWAAQGITDRATGFRAAPSAGALYPLEVHVAAGKVVALSPGVYRYRPQGHRLLKVAEGDKREGLFNAALRQAPVRDAAAVLAFSGVYGRPSGTYGERGTRYVHMEAGHAAQNVYLQAVSLGLGTVTVGAFADEVVKGILNMAADEQPLYLMPVGKLRDTAPAKASWK